MEQENEDNEILYIKPFSETDNPLKRKRSNVWTHFGRLYRGNVQVDDFLHCILCFNAKKMPIK